MATFLLDTNLLIALAWTNHIHHQAAHDWFATLTSDQWATCPMTQCGLVRISSNPKFMPNALTPNDAMALLEQMVKHAQHVFWEDDMTLYGSASVPRAF